MVSSSVPQGPARAVPRVRPHVATVVRRAHCLVLDFDGLVCDVPPQPRRGAVERTLRELLCGQWWAPRSILAGLGPWPETLGYLAAGEPDTFRLAEPVVTRWERETLLPVPPNSQVAVLLGRCAARGTPVSVVSNHSQDVVSEYLHAHGLDRSIAAVAGREGCDPDGLLVGTELIGRAVQRLDGELAKCLVVSASWTPLYWARELGTLALGCVHGRDSRKHLAEPQVPVVANLAVLAAALDS